MLKSKKELDVYIYLQKIPYFMQDPLYTKY